MPDQAGVKFHVISIENVDEKKIFYMFFRMSFTVVYIDFNEVISC